MSWRRSSTPKTVSNLQMIEALCLLCEEQARVMRAAFLRLGELGDTSLSDELASADEKYRAIIGCDEVPDEFDREEEEDDG